MTISPNGRVLRERGDVSRRFRAGVALLATHKRLVGAMALALVLGGYWHFMNTDTPTRGDRHTAAPVRTSKAVRRDMPIVEHTLGTVLAGATVQVTARVQGTLETAFFQEGQFVKKGDLLFQIDPKEFQADLAQAQAVLRRDETLLKNADRDKHRYEILYKQNAISSQQRDTAATNADAAAATVAVDRAAVRLAQLNMSYTQIRSPVDGKTGQLLIQPGNLVGATGATSLVTIAQIQPVKLSFNLPQSDFARIQARQAKHVLIATIDEGGARSGAGPSAPVDFVNNAIDDQSGTIELRATFANADLSLLPGQQINVTVELDKIPNALVVPDNAINDGPDGPYIYVVAKRSAVARRVKILFDDSKNAAIAGDVKPGDNVIVEGQLRVVPDGTVDVMPQVSGRAANSP